MDHKNLHFKNDIADEMIIELYTNAAEQRPNDEEILNHLFMANVRALNFKGQQQVATTLNKLWKSNPYLFWYLASLVQQVISINQD